MAKPDDIDMGIDAFDPDEIIYKRNPRRNRDTGGFEPMMQEPSQTATVQQGEDQPFWNNPRKARKANRNKADENTNQNAGQLQAETADREESEENAKKNPIVAFFTDVRLRYALGITLMFVCLFFVIALASHFKNAEHDQSIVLNVPLSEMPSNTEPVYNAGGGLGAWLSQAFFSDSLGLGTVFFIFYAWILAMGLLRFKKVQFWSLTFKTLLLAITTSIVLGLFTYNSETVFKWGGTHGHYVNKFLIDYTTPLGAIMVSALLILCVIVVYINELKRGWAKWSESANRYKLQRELAKHRERKLENAIDDNASQAENETESEAPVAQTVNVSADVDSMPFAQTVTTSDPEENNPQQPSLSDPFEHEAQEEPAFTFAQTEEAPAAESGFEISHVSSQETKEEEAPEFKFQVEDEQLQEEVEAFTIKASEIEEAKSIQPDNSSKLEPYDHRKELSRFKFPSIDILAERNSGVVVDMEEQQANKDRIVKTLADYNIQIARIEATVGPTVTLYEIVPAEGVRISQIKRLEDDIAMSLSALGIRIIAPIPGKGTVGIEVPNNDPQTVSMRSVITSKKYQECKMALPMAMGATISNEIFIADLAKMPHLLVAGATGMGKSVGLNTIIASLLYKKHPSELKFVLIDPKMVEFSLYSKLERHYLAKLPDEEEAIITDPNKVIQTLNSLCVEMDNRYGLLKKACVRTVEEYNKKFTDRRLSPNDGHFYMPYIVVVVDEFADLIMMAGKEVETPIARIAQKARAVGMHMIIATQRPSTNVITGLIKANFPGRIAFRVSQMVDSRTILDTTGANRLIGKGDMLFSHNGSMDRVQCAFISTEEVEEMVETIDNQVGYEHAYFLPDYIPEGGEGGAIAGASTERDSLFDEAARFVVQRQVGSTSSLQRQFNIGYNRAGRLMDQMEAAGIIGPVNGSKPRAILMDSMMLEHVLNQQ